MSMTVGTNVSRPVAITEGERLRRIAELLCKAILLSDSRGVVHGRPQGEQTAETNELLVGPDNDETNRVFGYLQLTEAASPLSIRSALGLSRSAAYRALQRLSHQGQIVASGHTRSIIYRLNQAEPPPEAIRRN